MGIRPGWCENVAPCAAYFSAAAGAASNAKSTQWLHRPEFRKDRRREDGSFVVLSVHWAQVPLDKEHLASWGLMQGSPEPMLSVPALRANVGRVLGRFGSELLTLQRGVRQHSCAWHEVFLSTSNDSLDFLSNLMRLEQFDASKRYKFHSPAESFVAAQIFKTGQF